MVNDRFYVDMSEPKLRAAYTTILRNIAEDVFPVAMEQERELIAAVAAARGIDLADTSASARIMTVQGYVEFMGGRDDDGTEPR